jgi:hypothetical protein
MSAATTTLAAGRTVTTSATSPSATSAYWERIWRTAGLQFVGFYVITAVIYGYQPGVGASSDALTAFYSGDRTRILIAATLFSLNVLNLLWFAAAIRTTLADADQDGWGAALTASSAAFGAIFVLLVTVSAALAYSIAGAGNQAVTSSLNDLIWAGVVLSSFPRAMLIMSGSFGLWRAGLFSNALFATGVTAMALVLLGGTAWLNGGAWAPDGVYSRFVSPAIGLAWIVLVSRTLLTRTPAARAGW